MLINSIYKGIYIGLLLSETFLNKESVVSFLFSIVGHILLLDKHMYLSYL